MVDRPMSPDERAFRAHLEQGPFQSGVERGRWRLIELDWPYAIIGIRAAARPGSPGEYAFRFECTNYPNTAPTAQPWDVQRSAPLARQAWPGGRSRVPLAFNPGWKEGQCLYLPCDRISLEGHDGWKSQHPSLLWSPAGDVTQYLRIVHELLTSSDYTGVRGA